MARPNQEAIDTFIGITGASEAVAVQKLEEHGGDLNAAVNAYFTEGDRSTSVNMHETPVVTEDDFMDIDDPVPVGPRRDPLSLLSATQDINPFSLNPEFGRSISDSGTDFTVRTPFVTHPREVREIPIEVKDGGHPSGHSAHAPTVDDVTGTAHAYGPGIPGTVTIDDDDDDDIPAAPTVQGGQGSGPRDNISGDGSHQRSFGPSAPRFDDPQDYSNDIEEEMIQAAIEASKREVEESQPNQQFDALPEFDGNGPQQRPPPLEDPELAHAVSLSLKTAEQEKALHEQGENVGVSEVGGSKVAEVELGKLTAPNGRLEVGSSSIQEETEDVEEQPLVRHRSRRMSSGAVESGKEIGATEDSAPSSPGEQDMGSHPRHSGSVFPTDEWGGISSEEHDEAVMLEAAMFGGIPEGTGYRLPYAPHHSMLNESPYPWPVPHPPSPTLTAQRLIREQQDDEYLASLQADREKELKAIEEAEALREEDRRKEVESRKKFEEEQELERQLAAKEATLPQEPASDANENCVTLLVRMPDGSRHGRRFLKTDKLQSLFDFIDIGRRVKPGSYRVVRPFPRRAFSDGESALTLNELGLSSKQEALFLELI